MKILKFGLFIVSVLIGSYSPAIVSCESNTLSLDTGVGVHVCELESSIVLNVATETGRIKSNNQILSIPLGETTYSLKCDNWSYTLCQEIVEKESVLYSQTETLVAIKQGVLTIPEGVTELPPSFLKDCLEVTRVILPNTLTTIGADAFKGCSQLKRVDITDVAKWCETTFENAAANPMNAGAHLYLNGTDITASTLTIPSGVTNLKAYTFAGGTFTSVVLPDSVKQVDANAFVNCSKLMSVTVPVNTSVAKCFSSSKVQIQNVTYLGNGSTIPESALAGLTALKQITIPNGVTNIVDKAFSGCSSLEAINLPSGLLYIGTDAFSGCSKLKRVDIPTVRDWCFVEFGNSNGNPLYAGAGALLYINGVLPTSLTIPEGITQTGWGAFYGCTNLTSITLPSTMNRIRGSQFKNCSNLKALTLPDGLPGLGGSAFYGCSSLTKINWPSTITMVDLSTFYGCSQLKRVDITDVAKWCETTFENAAANPMNAGAHLYLNGTDITASTLTIPSGVTNLKAYTFAGGTFSSVVLPDSVKQVDGNAFANCSKLTSVTVPMGSPIASWFSVIKTKIATVKFTGSGTVTASSLKGLTGLQQLILPSGVTTVESGAFKDCTALTRIDVPSLNDWLAITFKSTQDNPFYTGVSLYANNQLVRGFKSDVTSIGEKAYLKSNFVYLILPNGLKQIGAYAFATNTALKQIKFGKGGVAVGKDAFAGCTAINRVDVPSYADWCSMDFANAAANPISRGAALYVNNSKMGNALSLPSAVSKLGSNIFVNQKFTSVTLPTSVTNVSSSAFAGCSNITSVTLPWSISARTVFEASAKKITKINFVASSIGSSLVDSMCQNFTAIKEVTIPEGVVQLGESAFSGCTNLTRVVFPKGLTHVGTDAFAGCAALTRVEVPSLADWLAIDFANAAANPLSQGADLYVNGVKVTDLVVPAGTLALDDYAFTGGRFASVVLPDEITRLSATTFAGCSNVVSATIGRGLISARTQTPISQIFSASYSNLTALAYSGEVNLKAAFGSGAKVLPALREITILEGTVALADELLDGFALPESLHLPVSLFDIGDNDFRAYAAARYPDGLAILDGWVIGWNGEPPVDLVVSEGVRGIGGYVCAGFYDMETITLPAGLRFIGSHAFDGCTYLDNIRLPEEVEVIDTAAFKDCSYVQELDLGLSLREVRDSAFEGCTMLIAAIFPEGFETMGSSAFAGCWRMMSVSLPLSTRSVVDNAFVECDSLTGVTIPTHVEPLSVWFKPIYQQICDVTLAPGETCVRDEMFLNATSLKQLTLTSTLTNIGNYAFANCGQLDPVILPSGLQRVGEAAFLNNRALKSMGFPDTVVSIGPSVLQGCVSLESLALSRGLTEIPNAAFEGCTALTSFVVPATVTKLGSSICADKVSAVYFLGNAPSYQSDTYSASANLTTYVIRGTMGWDGNPTSRSLPRDWIGHPITLWTANQYDVTFDANGGIFAPVQTNTYACEQITYTVYALPPFAPTREGYRFAGYWTEPTAGTEVTASTPVRHEKPHTLYAHWLEVPRVQVRFNANGGTITTESAWYAAWTPYGSLPLPTREHYEFAGWYTRARGGTFIDEATEVPAADTELFAHWTPCVYTIRFHAANGTNQTLDQYYNYGETVTLYPNTFSTPNCTFAGWGLRPGADAIYADAQTLEEIANLEDEVLHLWAIWTGNIYNVRFDSHGGLGVMPNQTFIIDVAQALETNVFTREDFVFGGWARDTDSDASWADGATVKNLATNKGETVVLYAVWERASGLSYVTLDANGGTLSGDAILSRTIRGSFGTLPRPTREGYTFRNWAFRDGTQINSSTRVPQTDVTIYAVWQANKYRVRFEGNGGTGEMVEQELTYDEPKKLAANTFTMSRSVFSGWSLTLASPVVFTDTEEVVNLTAESDGVVTLYAQWQDAPKIFVTFDPAGGVLEETTLAYTIKEPYEVLPQPERVGYDFVQWVDAENNPITVSTIAPESPVTYRATWASHSYRVVFDPTRGTGERVTQDFVYDKPDALHANIFACENAEFKGWALTEKGAVAFADEAIVSNLTAVADGEVTLYAQWRRTDTPGEDYVELQSLSSTGTQYVDTGIVMAEGFVAELDCEAVKPASDKTYLLAAYDDDHEAYAVGVDSSGAYLCGVGAKQRFTGGVATKRTTVRFALGPDNTYTFATGGVVIATTTCTKTPTAKYSQYLFARNEKGAASKFATATLYSAKIYTNTTVLARDYVPWRSAAGEVGLFDRVTKTFVTAAGSGSFTAGLPVGDSEAGPTIGDEPISYGEEFTRASTVNPIVYPVAPTLEAEGASVKIVVTDATGRHETRVPAYYTPRIEGTTVYLALNENAAPTIGADAGDAEDGFVVTGETVQIRFKENAAAAGRLYYAIAIASEVTGEYEVPAGTSYQQATTLSVSRAAESVKGFYKIFVSDHP